MQKRREIQLPILAATILAAALVAGTAIHLFVIEIAVPATLLSTGLSSSLLIFRIPTWCLLAVVFLIAARRTHISLEIVVLHSVICHIF
jgi:hypothetical protein